MPAITIRGLSEESHRALKARAAEHGRSTEAEVRSILDAAVAPAERTRLGSLLAGIGRDAGGVELEVPRSRDDRDPLDLS
ncbi:MAG: hypothetical protein L0K86_16730 [Actinomycetia bacterium]|nr:hypothetical protein [Actinomycetes bacterium]